MILNVYRLTASGHKHSQPFTIQFDAINFCAATKKIEDAKHAGYREVHIQNIGTREVRKVRD
jgi:hypothetical protein